MGIELVGLIILAFGGVAILRSAPMALSVLTVGGLLGAASAMAFGEANITPGHLSMLLFAFAVFIRPDFFKFSMMCLQPLRPGLYLLALSVWALVAGYLLPRIFAGEIMAFPLNATTWMRAQERLFPIGSNLYQSIYFAAGLIIFVGVSSMVRTNSMMQRAGLAVLIAAGCNIAFGIIDLVTFSIGQSDLLQFIRNADYAQAYKQYSMIGTKRVNGSFPEPSSFAATSVALFAFCFRLWRVGIRSKITGPLALGTLIAIFLSFSSTGFGALFVYLSFAYAAIALGTDRQGAPRLLTRPNRSSAIMAIPLSACALVVVIALRPDIVDSITGIFAGTFTDKLASDSGVERTAWNMAGLRVFVETYGLGAGTGAVRTSSFVVAVLANLGLIGALLYAGFLWGLFRAQPERGSPLADGESYQYAAAARGACFIYLIAASVASPSISLGIHFYIFAGMACASLFYRRPVAAFREQPLEPAPAMSN